MIVIKKQKKKKKKMALFIIHQLIATVKFALDVKINCLCISNFFRIVLDKIDNTLDL